MALIAAAVLVGVGVSAWNVGRNASWWGASDSQLALQADPLAARDLGGLQLTVEQVAVPAGITGKPKGAFLHHWFTDQGRPGEVLAELARLATDQGWVERQDLSTRLVWVGRKTTSAGLRIRAVIASEPADGLVRVSLTIGP